MEILSLHPAEGWYALIAPPHRPDEHFDAVTMPAAAKLIGWALARYPGRPMEVVGLILNEPTGVLPVPAHELPGFLGYWDHASGPGAALAQARDMISRAVEDDGDDEDDEDYPDVPPPPPDIAERLLKLALNPLS